MRFFTNRIIEIKRAVYLEALRPSKVPDVLFWGFLSAVLPKGLSFRSKCNSNYIKYMIEPFLNYYDKDKDIFSVSGINVPHFPDYLLHAFFIELALEHSAFFCKYFDEYDKIDFDEYCKKTDETPYCYPLENNNVLIEKGDIVIDAGAWVGDFSAYAVARGAKTCYAFEPADDTFKWLKQIEAINPGVISVKSGMSDKKGTGHFDSDGISVGNKISNTGNVVIDLTTVDDFVSDNNLSRVDFIKADIEGAERNMLIGARKTLKEFAPKLSLCTYHLPDDPEVLEKLILEANPNYTVYQAPKKLYAYDRNRVRNGDVISLMKAD